NHDSIIADFEKKESIQLDQDQKDAVVSALSSGTVIITGGPGTGKTTIIKCILEIFLSLEYKVALAAPTGRAAKRMTEATGEEAKTLHRLLEYGYGEDDYEQTFERNEENPLEQDLIVIDEASMIDTLLMNHFLKAIAPGTRIILVGDVNQLPSVGPGNVLKDIIDSGVVKVVLLRKIFRQAQESQIVMNAHRINSGDLPIANEEGTDFFMLHAATQEKIRTKIIETCATRLTNYKDYDPFTDIQVITPVKKGPVGVKELNTALQGELNPPSQEKTERKFLNGLFREGDKVMQIKNNYGMKWSDEREGDGEGIFNGDIGRIQSIDESGKKVIVRFDDGKTVVYSFEQMDELVLSYAITVHKSQGSEFNAVVMPIFKGPGMLLNRNLLYTAVTRGKEMVVLIGHKPYLKFMIDNVNVNRRKTGLKERIAHDLWAD
ncbi:MAG TPA: ATP-dependent RecD-like DNA helicase, partial [Eubacteriaceae bacterium]|nr:ATP-dependent RecD-like DNA helicase [Eubacteriaceae bacterium]